MQSYAKNNLNFVCTVIRSKITIIRKENLLSWKVEDYLLFVPAVLSLRHQAYNDLMESCDEAVQFAATGPYGCQKFSCQQTASVHIHGRENPSSALKKREIPSDS